MRETHKSIWQRTKTEKKHLRLKDLQIDGWPLWFDCYKKRRVSGNSKHLDQGQIARNCQESSMRLQAKVSKAKEKRICSKMLVPLPSANSWSRILRELKTCRKRVACWAPCLFVFLFVCLFVCLSRDELKIENIERNLLQEGRLLGWSSHWAQAIRRGSPLTSACSPSSSPWTTCCSTCSSSQRCISLWLMF